MYYTLYIGEVILHTMLEIINITSSDLARRREALGMTQRDIALLLGSSSNSVSRWELGDSRVPTWMHWALRGIEQAHAVDQPEPAAAAKPKRERTPQEIEAYEKLMSKTKEIDGKKD